MASDETKPGITYEVCYPRTSGPFLSCTNTGQLLYSKDKKNRRQKKQKLPDDSLELESEWNDITNEEEASVFVKEKTPISIASWIIRPTDKASVYARNMGTTPTSAPKRPGSKKGKVIHLPKPVSVVMLFCATIRLSTNLSKARILWLLIIGYDFLDTSSLKYCYQFSCVREIAVIGAVHKSYEAFTSIPRFDAL